LDVTNLDCPHKNAPLFSSLVEDCLNVFVERRTLGQEFVEFMLTENRAQCRLRKHIRRGKILFDLND